MKTEDLLERIDYTINLGKELYKTLSIDTSADTYRYDSTGKFAGFKSSALSLISNLYGKKHSYYKEFQTASNDSYEYNINESMSILNSIKDEIQNGWLYSFRSVVSAELFSDFLEMSNYLLQEGYKDAAAVMIGSVLEENLRELCRRNKIDISIEKKGKIIHKSADSMNNDLYKENVYTSLEHKSILSWLDLRNKAAHGKYSEYDKNKVELMYSGVLNFLISIR